MFPDPRPLISLFKADPNGISPLYILRQEFPKPRIAKVAHSSIGHIYFLLCTIGWDVHRRLLQGKWIKSVQTWDSQIHIPVSLYSFDVMATGDFIYISPCPLFFSRFFLM